MRVFLTDEFEKRRAELSAAVQKRAAKQKALLEVNPLHPSLHIEKLVPKHKELWSMRVDRSYRILFRFLKADAVVFLTVGPHDWVYKIARRYR